MKNGKLLPNVPTHSGAAFTWHAGGGCTDASDLTPSGRGYAKRLYPDAEDVGFCVRSHRTGQVKVFSFVDTEEEDGELVCGVYESSDGVVVRVFND